MRCVKCGKIINETVIKCVCGRDMKDIRAIIGNFPESNKNFTWFNHIYNEQAPMENINQTSPLSGIGDLTDLLNSNLSEDKNFLNPGVDKEKKAEEKSSTVSLGEIGGDVNKKELEDALNKLKF